MIVGKPFPKGRSGNPGGRPKVVAEVQALARAHTAAAIETLADVMLHGKSEAARVSAAVAILDRGHGRAPLTVDLNHHTPWDDISTQQLVELAQSLRALVSDEPAPQPPSPPN